MDCILTVFAALLPCVHVRRRPPVAVVPPIPPGMSMEDAVRDVRKAWGVGCRRRYVVGLCGPPGAGKSSLLNCFIRKRPGDPGAAAVGETETTMKPTVYEIPGSLLILIDMPGGGTARWPAATYVRDTKLFACDAVLLMYNEALTEVCNVVLEHQLGLDIAIVRNMADLMVDNLRRNERLDPAPAMAKAHQLVDKEVLDVAPAAACTPRFIVSVYNMHEGRDPLDFPLLAKFLTAAAERKLH